MQAMVEYAQLFTAVVEQPRADGQGVAKGLAFQVKVFAPEGQEGPGEYKLPAVFVPEHLAKAFVQELLMAMARHFPDSADQSSGTDSSGPARH